MNKEQLYSMKIGDRETDSIKIVERVPGGWNYIYTLNGLITCVFVPFSKEERPKTPKQTTIPLTLEERKEQFKQIVIKLCSEKNIDAKTIGKEFFTYWSEHGESDKKMRFEKESTFGISARLSTFVRIRKNFTSQEEVKINPVKERMNGK